VSKSFWDQADEVLRRMHRNDLGDFTSMKDALRSIIETAGELLEAGKRRDRQAAREETVKLAAITMRLIAGLDDGAKL